jgi:hypothetical protein
MRFSRELLQASRHRRVRLLAALVAFAPDALVRADARPPALLASAPFALVLADARPPALLASAPFALVLADARPPALRAISPLALVLADCNLSSGAGACMSPPPPPPPPPQQLRTSRLGMAHTPGLPQSLN